MRRRPIINEIPPDLQAASRVVQPRDLLSSLLLQRILYFHSYFSLILITIIYPFLLRYKYLNNTSFYSQYLSPILYGLWVPIEILRLWTGYSGNLKEQVGSIAFFTFLTFFPQMFIIIYFTAIQIPLLPIDIIMGSIHFIVLIIEFVVGWIAVGRLLNQKTARFEIEFGQKDEEDDDGRGRVGSRYNDINQMNMNNMNSNNNNTNGTLGNGRTEVTPVEYFQPPSLSNTLNNNQNNDNNNFMNQTNIIPIVQSDINHNVDGMDGDGMMGDVDVRQQRRKRRPGEKMENLNGNGGIEMTNSNNYRNNNPNDTIAPLSSTLPPRSTLPPLHPPRTSKTPSTHTGSTFMYTSQGQSQGGMMSTGGVGPYGAESEEERLERRMRDRQIIREEMERKKEGRERTRGRRKSQTAESENNIENPNTNNNTLNNSTTFSSSFSSSPSPSPPKLSAADILSSAATRRQQSQIRREYHEAVQQRAAALGATQGVGYRTEENENERKGDYDNKEGVRSSGALLGNTLSSSSYNGNGNPLALTRPSSLPYYTPPSSSSSSSSSSFPNNNSTIPPSTLVSNTQTIDHFNNPNVRNILNNTFNNFSSTRPFQTISEGSDDADEGENLPLKEEGKREKQE